jgi:hypothetical protein
MPTAPCTCAASSALLQAKGSDWLHAYVRHAAPDDVLAALRSGTGDAAFEQAWARGGPLGSRRAVQYALQEARPDLTPPQGTPQADSIGCGRAPGEPRKAGRPVGVAGGSGTSTVHRVAGANSPDQPVGGDRCASSAVVVGPQLLQVRGLSRNLDRRYAVPARYTDDRPSMRVGRRGCRGTPQATRPPRPRRRDAPDAASLAASVERTGLSVSACTVTASADLQVRGSCVLAP